MCGRSEGFLFKLNFLIFVANFGSIGSFGHVDVSSSFVSLYLSMQSPLWAHWVSKSSSRVLSLHLLFIIVIKGFFVLIDKGVYVGWFRGISFRGLKSYISHVKFTNETLLFLNSYTYSSISVKHLFIFSIISNINLLNLSLGINISYGITSVFASILSCTVNSLFFSYIGLFFLDIQTQLQFDNHFLINYAFWKNTSSTRQFYLLFTFIKC